MEGEFDQDSVEKEGQWALISSMYALSQALMRTNKVISIIFTT